MSVRIISYLIFPLILLLILVSEPLIECLYGMKWMLCVPYFQILCIGGIFVCLQNINYYAVAAVGKSSVLFGWSFYKWGALFVLLLVGSLWGIYGILWAMVISNINIFIVNAILSYKYVGYTIWRQLYDLIPILAISIVSFISVYIINEHLLKTHFIITASLFVTIYLLLTWILHLRVINDIKQIKHSLRK